MLRYPPRRPKPATKTLPAPTPLFQGTNGLMLGFAGLIMAARVLFLVSATPAPAAIPGDQTVFTENDIWMPTPLTLTATQAGGVCTLNVSTMMTGTGTLTVLAVQPQDVLLTWAGGATAAGTTGCSGVFRLSAPKYLQLLGVMRPKAIAYR